MIAQLAVAAAVYAIDKPYSYRVPEGMQVQPGLRVLVPFGRGNRRSEAVVLALQDTAQRDLKVIERALDDAPILSQAQLQLAAFMKERYFCTFYEAVKAILPAGFWFAEKKTLTLAPGAQDKLPPGMANSDAARLVQLLQEFGGSAPERTLRQQFSSPQVFDTAVQQLLRRKLLRSDAELTQKTGGKTVKIAALAVSAEEAEQFAAKKQTSAPLQAAVLRLLCAIGAGPCREICALTGASMQTVTRLCKLGLLEQQEREVLRSPKQELPPPAEPITLTDEQQTAFDGLSAQMEREKPGAALLYGVTGSGKTAVYVALIQKALDEGRSAMLLVPEIALTPQLLGRMTAHFGKTVAVLHSSLRVGERYDEWRRIARGEARVVVGTRSAVFAPLQSPGLLILDEEQEHTYKSEKSPRYQARSIAKQRCFYHNATLLLASATPSLESAYFASIGRYKLFEMKKRYSQPVLPDVYLVDMKVEVETGNRSNFSRALADEIKNNLQRGEQTILLLNRRGYNTYMNCIKCGEVYKCPNCNIPLTYHKTNNCMICHYCGYTEVFTGKCKSCGSKFIYSTGTGTQRIEDEISTLFPSARVLRMDADTTMSKFSYEKNFDKFKNGEYDIMVGTQMIAKGLDFENVTLVGVLLIDKSLYAGDYLGYEKTFSLITQVVGRCGRGSKKGRAYLQTFSPEHYVLNLAADQNYDEFFRQECEIRKALLFPPYCDICEIGLSSVDESACKKGSDSFVKLFMKNLEGHGIPIRVLGPSACSVAKVNGKYRYRIIIKCRNNKEFRSVMKATLLDAYKSPALDKVSFFADMNGEII